MIHHFSVICMVLTTTVLALDSPCPDLFHYESTDQLGQWSGTVTLLSESQLYGVWVRLIFDEKLTELSVGDNFGEVVMDDEKNGVLIKNRNVILKPVTPTNIKINVKYNGDKVPRLTGFRLNARMVCSASNTASDDYYNGDFNNDLQAAILSTRKEVEFLDLPSCGTTPLIQTLEFKDTNAHWPWTSALYVQKNGSEEYVCGGTLISPNHILTSAHCVTYKQSETAILPSHLIVRLGINEVKEINPQIQKLEVEKLVIHPSYNAVTLQNDLAIIHLKQAATVNDNVRPICLPLDEQQNAKGLLAGFSFNKDQQYGKETQTSVKFLKSKDCLAQKLTVDNMLCVNYAEANSICVGNSGNGVVSLREGPKSVWELRGVVSLGAALQDTYECGPSSTVFLMDVGRYLKWIQTVIS